jgi:hypothetical protein
MKKGKVKKRLCGCPLVEQPAKVLPRVPTRIFSTQKYQGRRGTILKRRGNKNVLKNMEYVKKKN